MLRTSCRCGSSYPNSDNQSMSDILKKIVEVKREEIAASKQKISPAAMRADAESRVIVRDFVGSMRSKIAMRR
jgi:hypothetical protein